MASLSKVALRHLGFSGLALTVDGATLYVDPPHAGEGPAVITWTERERISGVQQGEYKVAGHPAVLDWQRVGGVPLAPDGRVEFAGFSLRCTPFTPIPYATPPEALRKLRSAVISPRRAVERVRFALDRPRVLPLVLSVERAGVHVLLLSQALHRFSGDHFVDQLAVWAGSADLIVAGTDYDDEAATGQLLGRFKGKERVIADLTGPIRRLLGLPVRPLSLALASAPVGTSALPEGGVWRRNPVRFDTSGGVSPTGV